MTAYLFKRLLLMIPTLVGVLLVSFIIIQFVPGGPVEQLINELAHKGMAGEAGSFGKFAYRGATGLDAQRLAEIRTLYGFDKPAAERFFDMLWKYARFDFGESFFHHRSVFSLLVSKLPVSISLGGWSFLLIYTVSIPLGICKAVRDGSRFDAISSIVLLIGYAIPGFVLGLLLLVLFGGGSFLNVFPMRGLTSDDWVSLSWNGQVIDYLWHLVLPVVASSVSGFAVITFLTKNSFIEEIRKQYVLTARAKGLDGRTVLLKHVLRNAMIPLVTGFPAAFIGMFFTGSLLIETTFSLDGLGLLSYESVLRRDYPVVLGTLYLYTLLGLFAKLLSDLSYVLVDPRIGFETVS